MSEVMGIAKGHHGALFVVSQLGKGTTVQVLFLCRTRVRPHLLVTGNLWKLNRPRPESLAEVKLFCWLTTKKGFVILLSGV